MAKSFANREVADLMFVEYETKKPFMNFDLANTTGYDLEGDTVFAYGGQGHPKRVSFAGSRSGTFRVETQMQTVKLYQMITGGTEATSVDFLQREVLTADGSGVLTMGKTPIAGSAYVFPFEDDCGTAATATIDVDSKTATVSDASEGDKFVVYYLTKLQDVNAMKITTKTFPRAFTIYGETYEKTSEDEIIPYKMIAYKATPQSNFSVDFSNEGDPTTISITFDLQATDDGDVLDLIMEE